MSLKKLQEDVREHDRRLGWVNDLPHQTLLHIVEELGEVSRELLKCGDYKPQQGSRQRMSEEIVDLLYLNLKLANLLGLDLDKTWEDIGERYAEKI